MASLYLLYCLNKVDIELAEQVVVVRRKPEYLGGNPPVWLGDHMTISHADVGYHTWVETVRGEMVTTAPARQLKVAVVAAAVVVVVVIVPMNNHKLVRDNALISNSSVQCALSLWPLWRFQKGNHSRHTYSFESWILSLTVKTVFCVCIFFLYLIHISIFIYIAGSLMLNSTS